MITALFRNQIINHFITNLFLSIQGLLFSTADCIKTTTDLLSLWVHEAQRVYGDKMVETADIELFTKIQKETFKKSFEDVEPEEIFSKTPLIYCHFATGIGDPKYMPVQNWESLNKLLVEALDNYNELNAAMNLVLFEDAMQHICRISRILESPRGNALLIGVGGKTLQVDVLDVVNNYGKM